MKNKSFTKYYIFSIIGVALASFYPLYMGAKVIYNMVRFGALTPSQYPKYVIPYTPISLALIIGVALMPLLFKLFRKYSFLAASAISVLTFLVSEHIMETKILIETERMVPLEGWQMSLCYVPPELFETRVWEAVDVLLGGYSPTFKIHFYAISVVLIISLLNSIFGFGDLISTQNKKRLKPLVLQSVSALLFLGMCIWACFTSFYRGGELTVSPISAVLMCAFFVLFGLTVGILVGSFTIGKERLLSIALPSVVASFVTLIMYVGEMFLLNGELYRFGKGGLFERLGIFVLAPIDILMILLSAVICGAVLYAVRDGKRKAAENKNGREIFIFLMISGLSFAVMMSLAVFIGKIAVRDPGASKEMVENINELNTYDLENFFGDTFHRHILKGGTHKLISFNEYNEKYPVQYIKDISDNTAYAVFKLCDDNGDTVYVYSVFSNASQNNKQEADGYDFYEYCGELYLCTGSLRHSELAHIKKGVNASEVANIEPAVLTELKVGGYKVKEFFDFEGYSAKIKKTVFDTYLLLEDGVMYISFIADDDESDKQISDFTVDVVRFYEYKGENGNLFINKMTALPTAPELPE